MGDKPGDRGLARFVEEARGLAPPPFVHGLLRQVVGHAEGVLRDDATAVIVDLL